MPNAQGVPDRLSPDAAAMYKFIGSYVSQGVGADRTYRLLREQGQQIPRATVRTIAAEIRISLQYRAELARLNPDNPVPGRLSSIRSESTNPNHIHVVSLIVIDEATGYTLHKFARYVSPELATPREVMSRFTTPDLVDPRYGEFQLISQSLVDVFHGAG